MDPDLKNGLICPQILSLDMKGPELYILWPELSCGRWGRRVKMPLTHSRSLLVPRIIFQMRLTLCTGKEKPILKVILGTRVPGRVRGGRSSPLLPLPWMLQHGTETFLIPVILSRASQMSQNQIWVQYGSQIRFWDQGHWGLAPFLNLFSNTGIPFSQ